MNTSKHKIWIKTVDKNLFTVVITYGGTTTKESLIEGKEAVQKRVEAFKLLYDGDFEVLSDFNFS